MIIGLKNFEFMDCIRVICHVWTFQCYSNSYEVISKFGDDTYSNLTCGETKLVFGSKTIVSDQFSVFGRDTYIQFVQFVTYVVFNQIKSITFDETTTTFAFDNFTLNVI